MLPFLETQNFRSIIQQLQDGGVSSVITKLAKGPLKGKKNKPAAEQPIEVPAVVPPQDRPVVRAPNARCV